MKKAHLHLIKMAIADGHVLSVWNGEGWEVKKSNRYKEIKDAVEGVDDSEIRIRNTAGEIIGTARVILEYDQRPDEIINDYVGPYMEKWDEIYMAEIEQ